MVHPLWHGWLKPVPPLWHGVLETGHSFMTWVFFYIGPSSMMLGCLKLVAVL